MIRLVYKGELVSCNKRLAKGKNGYYNQKVYKAALDSMIYQFKGKCKTIEDARKNYFKLFYFIHPKKDVHNCQKITFDSLQGAGIVKDDKHIEFFSVGTARIKQKEEESLVITIS